MIRRHLVIVNEHVSHECHVRANFVTIDRPTTRRARRTYAANDAGFVRMAKPRARRSPCAPYVRRELRGFCADGATDGATDGAADRDGARNASVRQRVTQAVA
jgi:hypothetical protein